VTEPIAIVGMACRFPGGANSPEAFWQLLLDGEDAIRPICRDGLEPEHFYDPTPRTPGRMASKWAGLLDDLEYFDPGFFGISPREAGSVDPSQRLLLEAAWEAFEDATIDPTTVAGGAVGVFVGQWVSDFEGRVFSDTDRVDFHATTGSGRYGTSGRLSYVLKATGPSFTVDTACSSSLVAVHLACRSLQVGETDLAIAAGVNVILQPQISIAYSQNGMMAPDGHCKFGDANGDGYVRSEGAGVVLLKPLGAALADGDNVRAVIRGSAVNNDGGSSGHMGAPSRSGQAAMLRAAYENAGIAPTTVSYVEAHGTGTRAGDPVELGALSDVLAAGRDSADRCIVGSAKTNIGHTEGAAGMAGLIKCVMALEHEQLPGSLHLNEPNPAIPWDELPFDIPQHTVPWPRDPARRRIAGVSGYGISGTNAHVVLEEPPAPGSTERAATAPTVPLVLSATTPAALSALAASYADLLERDDAPALVDVAATAARHRAALPHRAVFIGADPAEMAGRLRRFAEGETESADAAAEVAAGTARRVAFVFPGQGGQWTGMARELLAEEPAFRAAIERCDAALPSDLGWTVSSQLAAECGEPQYRLGEIGVIQPVLLAVEIALAELWRSWGVAPEAVLGHSMGEVGAAYVAGALSLEEAMQVICLRSALMQRTSGAGAMALLELGVDDVRSRIEPLGDRVCVAVVNGTRSTVVSGDADAVAEVVAEAKRDAVFARAVKVDVASHSAHMDPLVPELVERLGALAPRAGRFTMYSTVDAAVRPGDTLTSAYWGRNLRQPVQFARTVDVLLADGIDTLVEVGPHPTLLTSIGQVAEAGEHAVLTIGSLQRSSHERPSMLASLGALWAAGQSVTWESVFPNGLYRRVRLPTYPWQRERHWSDAARPVPPGGGKRKVGLDDTLKSWLHTLCWQPAAVPPAATTAAEATTWLVVGDDDMGASALQRALAERGASAHVVASNDAAVAWMQEVLPETRPDLRLVRLCPSGSLAFEVVAAVQLLQQHVADGLDLRLWWVTSGAHVLAGGGASPTAPRSAATWGAARVVAVEHPRLWGGLIDLDPTVDAGIQVGALADHLCADDGEDQVAIRDGSRHALRLVSAEAPEVHNGPGIVWRSDAAYLITGGLGGVAREIAAAMVRDGARRLVLLGRSPLPPRSQWAEADADSEVGRRIAAVRALEHAGASVHLLHADVSDESAMKAALDAYAAEGWPPIAGVVHTAGVLDSRLTADLDEDTFERVLAPKLDGALVLDRLLPRLDLFVVFSSFFSFWGAPGMANYAAANAGLDALAASRRARGQHALSIQWGAWADVGMLTRSDSARTMADLERFGVGTFSAAHGTELFLALVAGGEPVITVLPVDWDAFRRFAPAGTAPLFRSAPGSVDEAGPMVDDVLDELREASPAERRDLLERLVRGALGGVLRMPPAQLDVRRSFGSLGLDSLLALELRNRLEAALALALPASLAWNYPTIEALTIHLDALLSPATEVEAAVSCPAVSTDADLSLFLDDIDALSDDEAARLLRDTR
jgi:acyl transferase domain-containing protein